MAKMLSNFGEQHMVMVNYACGFNQSETGKYFECIIIEFIIVCISGLTFEYTLEAVNMQIGNHIFP